MNEQEFGERYVRYATNIEKVLKRLEIYDEDLLHDTYIALYYHSRHAEIVDFVNTFVAFYKTRCKRKEEHESHYDACEDSEMLEKYDRADESDLEYREEVGKKVDKLMRYLKKHPQPGAHNHKQACKILRLHLEGLTEREISNKLKISQQAVNQSLRRTIEWLQRCQEMATI